MLLVPKGSVPRDTLQWKLWSARPEHVKERYSMVSVAYRAALPGAGVVGCVLGLARGLVAASHDIKDSSSQRQHAAYLSRGAH